MLIRIFARKTLWDLACLALTLTLAVIVWHAAALTLTTRVETISIPRFTLRPGAADTGNIAALKAQLQDLCHQRPGGCPPQADPDSLARVEASLLQLCAESGAERSAADLALFDRTKIIFLSVLCLALSIAEAFRFARGRKEWATSGAGPWDVQRREPSA